MNPVEEFHQYRSRMNLRILSNQKKIIKRIFNLESNAYEDGNPDKKTKEFIGLPAHSQLSATLLNTTLKNVLN